MILQARELLWCKCAQLGPDKVVEELVVLGGLMEETRDAGDLLALCVGIIDEDVVAADVAMGHVIGVQVLKRKQHIFHNL